MHIRARSTNQAGRHKGDDLTHRAIDLAQTNGESFALGENCLALQSIREPCVSVAIWERRLPPAVERKLASWGTRAPLAFDALLDSAATTSAECFVTSIETSKRGYGMTLPRWWNKFLSLADVSRFGFTLAPYRTTNAGNFTSITFACEW